MNAHLVDGPAQYPLPKGLPARPPEWGSYNNKETRLEGARGLVLHILDSLPHGVTFPRTMEAAASSDRHPGPVSAHLRVAHLF